MEIARLGRADGLSAFLKGRADVPADAMAELWLRRYRMRLPRYADQQLYAFAFRTAHAEAAEGRTRHREHSDRGE